MGGRGSGSGMAWGRSYQRGMKQAEDKIRDRDVEHCSIVDGNGKTLMTTSDGAESEIRITPDMQLLMRDNAFTHNHPKGSTFSEEDVNVAVVTGAREIRATHRNGTYILTRIGNTVTAKARKFATDYQKAYNNYKRDIVDSIYNSTGDSARCNQMVREFRQQWLRDNSESYGYIYREERRK